MEYKAYIKQDGEGCDYTIGCAQTVIDIQADSIENARVKLLEIIEEDYTSLERRLDFAEIYEVGQTMRLNLHTFYNHYETKFKKRIQDVNDEKEQKEYERLQAKFGAKN